MSEFKKLDPNAPKRVFRMFSRFDKDEAPIELLVDGNDLVVATDAPDGMTFVKRYTDPYTQYPHIKVLAHAADQQYLVLEKKGKVSKDDESEDEPTALMEISKTDEDKRLVFGWAYQTHDKDGNLIIDKSGEYMDDPEELERAAYNYVIKSRHQGDMHRRTMANETMPVGTMVESMVFTPEKIAKMGLPPGSLPTGWWTGFRVDDDDAWAAVKRGERKSFSIHGKAVRKEH